MICNSTVLIYLAKLNRLDLLKDLGVIIIPEAVKHEVVDQGKPHNHSDAFLVEKAINDGWIKVRKSNPLKELEEIGIDKGELEAISLAYELKKEILLDQTHARLAANIVGLKPKGTIFVLLKALKRNKITYDEYIDYLEELIKHGFRMSQEVYLEAVKLGKSILK